MGARQANHETLTSRGGARRRRRAEETRLEILEAAQRKLVEGGPEAIRLTEIARDVGISHPAILHHFGSRDGLMSALELHVTQALTTDVARVLVDPDATGEDLIESVARAMDEGGLARLIAWWLLQGEGGENGDSGSDEPRRIVGQVAQQIRERLAEDAGEPGRRVPQLEEVAFAVRLAVVAIFGDSLFGSKLGQAPEPGREQEQHRFRLWLSNLLTEHLLLERRAAPRPGSARIAR